MVAQQKPPAVLEAMRIGDIAFLSVLGKRGAEKRKNKKRKEQEKLLDELNERACQANENICPVDD